MADFGTFSEPGCLASGDPYREPGAAGASSRRGGKQFLVSPPKQGKGPDAYFDNTVRSLALGDRYTDAWIQEKRLARLPGGKLYAKPFCTLAGSRGSISCGPGSSDGCLSRMSFDTDGSAAAARSSPGSARAPSQQRPASGATVSSSSSSSAAAAACKQPRNFYTSAPKRGGFGRPLQDVMLGERLAPPKYYSDVYEGGREKEKELRASAKALDAKPFVSSVSRAAAAATFTRDSELYQQQPGPPRERGCASPGGAAASRSSSSTHERPASAPPQRPWRPSSPPRKGAAFCVLSQAGRNYVPDPVREAQYHAKQSGTVKPFRPASGSKPRLSMWSPNPYAVAARPAPDIDFTIT